MTTTHVTRMTRSQFRRLLKRAGGTSGSKRVHRDLHLAYILPDCRAAAASGVSRGTPGSADPENATPRLHLSDSRAKFPKAQE